MWTAVRIGVFYAAPVIAIGVAVAYFAVLMLRVRRGAIDGSKAALRYTTTLLLPVAVILIIWGAGEIASYFAAPGDFQFDVDASRAFFVTVLPLGIYVGVPIFALVVAFWTIVRRPRLRRRDV